MNKMISFRDLIDLEPKPNKIKYDTLSYEYDGEDYIMVENGFVIDEENMFLENNMSFMNMNTPNIEIIEEDKPRIEKLKIKQGVGNNNYYLENEEGIKCGMPKHALVMSNKINELCDIINDMEKER